MSNPALSIEPVKNPADSEAGGTWDKESPEPRGAERRRTASGGPDYRIL